ncbi:MAG: cytochrome b/b6 domain-containing protein [Pseudomonadales bacterium]|nr:cytochrome b/b6 domain-containing protein [Pseudomonadales bacterium]
MTASSLEKRTEAKAPMVSAHSPMAVFLHWGFVGVFVYALTKQIDELEELEDASLLQNEMMFATLFLTLLLSRFVYMRSRGSTALPSDTPRLNMLMARAVHLGMYVSLAMIAVTGLVIGVLYWSGFKAGAGISVVLIAHELFVQLSYLLIFLHVSAALYHRRKRDGIWSAMVPFLLKEGSRDSFRN